MNWVAVRYSVHSVVVVIVCLFLVFPIVAIVPVSFTETNFIRFPPQGFSLQWYGEVFSAPRWRGAAVTSFVVALLSATLATIAGTLAALGMRYAGARMAKAAQVGIMLPLVVPTIITAVALYGSFSAFGLVGTVAGLVLAHTILGLPFVVINVSAVMQRIDWQNTDAARSLGATPQVAFWKVTLPALKPGVIAGAVFAFLTSFDEVVVALFISGVHAVTLPVQMWSGIRFEISPAVAAVACLLIIFSALFLTVYSLASRRS